MSMIKGGGRKIAKTFYVQLLFFNIIDCFYESIPALSF